MKVTHVRIRKLVSHANRFGHEACELEAQVEDGEDWEVVAEALRQEVDAQLRHADERSRLIRTLDDLRAGVVNLEREAERIRASIAEGRNIIRQHDELAEIARERGLDADALRDPLPF